MLVPLPIMLKSEYFTNCVVAAGERGLNRDVTSINIIDGAYGYKYSQENMFVLCSAYSIAASSERQVDLIEQVALRGVVGIGVKPIYFPDGQIPQSMIDRADELGIPLIALDINCPSYADYITFFANSVYLRGTQSIMPKNELLKLLIRTMNKDGLPGLVETISTMLKKNVSVLFEDEHYTYPVNDETTQFGKVICAQSGTWNFYPSPTFEGMLSFSDKVGTDKHLEPDKLGIAVRSGKNTIAYLWVYGNSSTCCPDDAAVLDAASLACELEVAQILTYQQQEARRRALFVEQLLTGKLGTLHEAMLMTKGLQWRIPLEVRIMVVSCFSESILCQEVELELNELFRQQQKNIIVFPYHDDVAVLLPHPHDSDSQYCQELISALEQKFGAGTLRFGIGRGMALKDTHKSYSQACYALQVGKTIKPEQITYHFEHMGMFRLYCADALPEELRLFCADYVVPLFQVDATAKLDLLKTLEIFFACKENYSRAGNMLYLHPNTIRYRIETIEKICKVDFSNPADILNMQIALKLLPVVKQDYTAKQPLCNPGEEPQQNT